MSGSKPKAKILSLEDLCTQRVCECSRQYPDAIIDELNYPCLHRVVKNLSMYDILRREQFLEERGFNTQSLLERIRKKGFLYRESHPIASFMSPHLLFTNQGICPEWSLSKLFWESTILKAAIANGYRRKEAYLASLQHDYYLARYFQPLCRLEREPVRLRKIPKIPYQNLMELFALVAPKIKFLRVDPRLCHFLMWKESLKKLFLTSITSVSVNIMKNESCELEFIKCLTERPQGLTRISLHTLKNPSMEFLDQLLSLCSGADSLQKRGEKACAATRSESDIDIEGTDLLVYDEDGGDSDSKDGSEEDERRKDTGPDLDLMDYAVVLERTSNPTHANGCVGVPMADIKISNLTPAKNGDILAHHFASWTSLTHLHLSVPELDQKMLSSLCLLVGRRSFQVLYLSAAVFNHPSLEELLVCVATKRNGCPLEKLMLVNIEEVIPDIQESLTFNHLQGMNEVEVSDFAKKYESKDIGKSFQGTKLLELCFCNLGVRNECLVMQYILGDTALRQLYLHNSLSRLFVRATLGLLSLRDCQLTCLVIQDWSMSVQEDCNALVRLLLSVSSTLVTLSLYGCLRSCYLVRIKPVMEAIAACQNLKSLDLSAANIRDDPVEALRPIARNKNLKELCLRTITCKGNVMTDMLNFLASLSEESSPQFDLVDLKENLPGNNIADIDQVFMPQLVQRIAKRVFFERGFFNDGR